MNRASWWIPAATGIAGLAAGYWLAGRAADPPAMPGERAPERPAVVAVAPIDAPGLDAEDVRRVVREELAAHRASADAPRGSPDSSPADPPSQAQAAAATQAEALLRGALARRSWTEADADALRSLTHELPPDRQAEILRQLAVAINQGRIVPQTERIPF
jgi:hypothetical protein